jgi:HlyD family secretion protein
MDRKEFIKTTVIEFLPDADEIERSPLPPLARATLYALLLALISLLLWAIFAQIDRVVVAKGRLVTPLPNIVVQPLETAIIETLDVRIGQIVQKGEQLATLDPTFAEADQSQLKNRLDSLNTQMLRLKAELDGGKEVGENPDNPDSQLQAQLDIERKANYKAQQKHLFEKIAQLHATISTNFHDQQALAAKLKPIQEIEAMQNSLLSKQYGARLQMLESQQKRMEVERDLQLAKNKEHELKSELAALEAEKSMFDKGWRQKIMEDLLATERESNELKEQLLKAEKRNRLVKLSSPVNAVVLDIGKLSVGSVARAAEPLFTLVPLDTALEAEVQVDSLDIGYIALDDTAKIKIDSFPFQRHGALEGKVRTISEDAFRRESPGSGIDAYYLSRIDLGSTPLKNMTAKARLLPGMTLTAEIVVGKRSVISYLIWPIAKGLNESIHEP